MRMLIVSLLCGMTALAGCTDIYPPTPNPGYTIHVVPAGTGVAAIPPACPSWAGAEANPYENQLYPQFGCANARNLAMMVERPSDLVDPRELGPSSGNHAVGAMMRYNSDQTRGLIWTGTDPNQVSNTTSSTASSAISGEAPTASSSASSSSSSSSTPTSSGATAASSP